MVSQYGRDFFKKAFSRWQEVGKCLFKARRAEKRMCKIIAELKFPLAFLACTLDCASCFVTVV